jgi:nucleotide-binding universal stress UspA family protein
MSFEQEGTSVSGVAGTIVVGVDGSSSSSQALLWAVGQATAERRTLTLLHALPRITPASLDPTVSDPREAQELLFLAGGQEALDRARGDVHRLAPDLKVRDLLRPADPREALIEVSETAAMIVLGSRGRGHMKSLLLGSTAVAVVRHAHCPVVVHRPTSLSPVRNGIAVGADASEDSLPVLDFAFRQASIRNLPLTVVHSFWSFQQPSTVEDVDADQAAATLELQLALSESLAGFGEKYPDVRVHTEIDQGMPERFLLRLADEMDLLVVGAHHVSRGQQFMFGSVSVWLVEHASCPVAVVPPSTERP